jgi:Tol biopolymer transport system component
MSPSRRVAAVLWSGLLAAGCDGGTVNDGDAVALPTTLRVSLSAEDREGSGGGFSGAISEDGGAVGFSSDSIDLHPESRAGYPNAYVKDLRTRKLYLLNRRSGEAGAVSLEGGSFLGLSRNGRRAAFLCSSSLDAADPGGASQVYVRDLDTHETFLASRVDGKGAAANRNSFAGVLSADGLWAAFSTAASNLVNGDADTIEDVYLHHLPSGATSLVSRADGAAGAKSTSISIVLDISENGSKVLFMSASANLWSKPWKAGTLQLFVRDTGVSPPKTELVSRGPGADGLPGTLDSGTFSNRAGDLSSDGRFVVFASHATNLHPDDEEVSSDVFLRDLADGSMDLISRASGVDGAKGLGYSGLARVSRDGRFVAFLSPAANLIPDDRNDREDVFLRDRVTFSTTRLSLRTFGSEIAGGVDGQLSLAEDASAVAFVSSATDIVQDDSNGFRDVFVRSPIR